VSPIDLEPDPRLLRARPRIVYVEMTSRCNLRCVYCPVSQPDYQGEDLEMDVEALARLLRRCHPAEVQMSGHGETTMLPYWTGVTRQLLEHGLPLTLTTNLAKRMSDDEVDVLSRFRALKVSVDTTDAELQGRLRRNVRLERIEETLRRVVERCRADYRDLPYIQISCTVVDSVVGGLPDLVRWSVAQGAHGLGLVNLVRHPDPPDAMPILHPAEVDAAAALAKIEESRALATELGLDFETEPGLMESLEVPCP
jgi:MoaA/NifB/PqqE/SkfB family radical SAM enzyme